MSFVTHNQSDARINVNGTHLQGYVSCSYDDLVKAFGEPLPGCDKTDAEWHIQFTTADAQHVVATVYNYKDGRNYRGSDGMDTSNITDWHIGGIDKVVVDLIAQVLRKKTCVC
jgi:hypothetical protein